MISTLLQGSKVRLREVAKLAQDFASAEMRGCHQTTLDTNSSGGLRDPHMVCSLRKVLHWPTHSIPTRTLHVVLVFGRS